MTNQHFTTSDSAGDDIYEFNEEHIEKGNLIDFYKREAKRYQEKYFQSVDTIKFLLVVCSLLLLSNLILISFII